MIGVTNYDLRFQRHIRAIFSLLFVKCSPSCSWHTFLYFLLCSEYSVSKHFLWHTVSQPSTLMKPSTSKKKTAENCCHCATQCKGYTLGQLWHYLFVFIGWLSRKRYISFHCHDCTSLLTMSAFFYMFVMSCWYTDVLFVIWIIFEFEFLHKI